MSKYRLVRPKGNSPAGATKFNSTGFGVFKDDIVSFPTRDENGIRLVGDVVLKPDAQFFEFYHTSSKADASFEVESEQDLIKITPKFTTQHPGNSVESREFLTAHMGRDVILFVGQCDEDGYDVIGEICLPLQLVPSQTNNSDGKFFTLLWQAHGTTDLLNAFYEGNIIRSEVPVSPTASVSIDGSKSKTVRLAPATETADIDFTLTNVNHNDSVTVVGSGGPNPFTLKSGETGSVTTVLKNGTEWSALKDASITLKYVDGGSKQYLVEVSRG